MNEKLMVRSISVQSFRGIGQKRTLDLNKITVIHGENGTGKSSFVDAFEYLFSGSLKSLNSRTIDPESFFHVKYPENFNIEVKFPSKSYLKRDASNKPSCKGFIKEILNDSYIKNASFVLKRRNLLDFVEGTQKDRYDSISSLCGFEDFSKVQTVLSSSLTKLNNKLKDKENGLNKFTEKLSELLVENNSLDLKECFNEINKLLKDTGNNLIDENTDFNKYSNEISFSKDNILINDQLAKFNELYDSLNLDLTTEFDILIKDYKNLAIESFKSSASLLNVLNVSKSYLTLENTDECPICHSTINSQEILDDIDKEINDLKNNNSKLNLWKNNVEIFINNLSSIQNDLNKLNDYIYKLSEFDTIDFNEEISFKNINFKIDDLILILKDLLEFNYSSKIDNYDLSIFLKEYSDIKLSFDNYFKNFKLSDNIFKLNKIKKALDILSNRKKLGFEIKILRKKAETAEITFNIFKSKKEEFIRSLLLKIVGNIRAYYEYIHDDEYISSPDIKISNSNLVDVILNSYGKDVDARSYASEGHLDTLGLCIFLAFNKEFSKIPLIVLDDVVATVDYVHKDKIARLLIDKFEDYQFFITTHNKLWAEQIKRLVSATHNNVRVYEIIDWDVFEGPVLSKPLNPEQKIEKYLKGQDKDLFAAGNTARRYLEYILKRICDVNNIKVPYKEKYDVGSLFVDTKDSCLNFVKKTDLEDYYTKIWTNLERTQDRGNLLSHDNIISMDLSNTDVKGFCEAVIALRKAYVCYCNKSSYLKFDSKNKKFICNNCNSSENMNQLGKFDLNVKNFGKNVIDSSDYIIGYLAKFNNGRTVDKSTAKLMIPLIKNQLSSKNIDDLNKIIYVSKIINIDELKIIFAEELEDYSIGEKESIESLINDNDKLFKLNNESFLLFDYKD